MADEGRRRINVGRGKEERKLNDRSKKKGKRNGRNYKEAYEGFSEQDVKEV